MVIASVAGVIQESLAPRPLRPETAAVSAKPADTDRIDAVGASEGVSPSTNTGGSIAAPGPSNPDAHADGRKPGDRDPRPDIGLDLSSLLAELEERAVPGGTDSHGGTRNLFAEARADVLADPSLRRQPDDPTTPIDESQVSPDAVEGVQAEELTPDQQSTVRELQARDREVRSHEHAHAGAGGGLAGSPSYVYQTGPDGQRYAVGGEVQIRSGGGSTPEARLREAAQVRSAALAPANPSGADLAVAGGAAADAAAARAELSNERTRDRETTDSSTTSVADANTRATLSTEQYRSGFEASAERQTQALAL